MMELIQIQQTEIQNEVVSSARDLHTELNISKDFSEWIKAQINRADLAERFDFIKLPQKGELSKTGQIRIEYILTLDSAKHIAMMSQSKKAKEIRNYFISVEKKFKQIEKAYHEKNQHQREVSPTSEITQLVTAINAFTNTMIKKMDKVEDRLDALERPPVSTLATKHKPISYEAPIVPRWILASNLSPLEKIICGTVATYADELGHCSLTNPDLAQMHCMKIRNVSDVISNLYKKGVLKRIGNRWNRKLKIEKLLGDR